MVSPHQCAFLRPLAENPKLSVTLVVDELTSKDRTNCGWASPSLGKVRFVVAPDSAQIDSLLEEDAVHVISGFRFTKRLQGVAHRAARRRLRYGILTEGMDSAGWRGRVRECLYQYERWFHGSR